MGNIKVEDQSGDRKFFTVIPNYVLNHSTMWDREVYIQMKRITGEGGQCWTSQKTLATQCGMSVSRLKKSIKYLVEHGWIKLLGKKEISTPGGPQEVNEYSIADLWKKNIDFYESKGVSPENPPSPKGKVSVDAKGRLQKPTNKNQGTNKNPYIAEPSKEAQTLQLFPEEKTTINSELKKEEKPFDFDRIMESMAINPRIAVKIVRLYWKERELKFENNKQYQMHFGRDIKDATLLEGYNYDQILETIRECEIDSDYDKKYKWGLSTVVKKIALVVNKK